MEKPLYTQWARALQWQSLGLAGGNLVVGELDGLAQPAGILQILPDCEVTESVRLLQRTQALLGACSWFERSACLG